MEKYIIKIQIENVNGIVVNSTEIDTDLIDKAKNLGGLNMVNSFIENTLMVISEERKLNPYNHQNRVD